ncbi:MAG: glutamine amidotransferase [Planctomycetes bacterium]|nr:glutamine amidotransferase [Planctomycetota bacterium]
MSQLLWGAPEWALPAIAIASLALLVLVWSYLRAGGSAGVRLTAATLKTLGIAALAICLAEPLVSGSRPRPGANLFVLLADNSQSLAIHDSRRRESRGEALKNRLTRQSAWRERIEQDFDVRRYAFDSRLRAMPDFDALDFTGDASTLAASLDNVARRFQGRPLAGVLLFTDGNATDIASLAEADLDWSSLPPIYPVAIGDEAPARDLAVGDIRVSQTNFEAAPVTVQAEIESAGYDGARLVAQLLDKSGKVLQEQPLEAAEDGVALSCRFQVQPERGGVHFYQVRVSAKSEVRQFDNPERSREATLANNSRFVVVDRGQGPYRVLYVAGRPNWEYKFLRRALEADREVELVALVRIANREPKFVFREKRDDGANPLFRGFDNVEAEEAEQYDQPVLLRLGTEDAAELRDGFPKAADQLFRYHAVVLDDVEAEYFSPDQMRLVQDFVRRRGGGLLMLGGQESFVKGEYDRTPLGELLPVYLERIPRSQFSEEFRLSLTREGWLSPWVRVRSNEQDERKRLAAMPPFQTVNAVRGIKPGASVLATVMSDQGEELPALVAQPFGAGRAAALTVGDLWRWGMRRRDDEESDLEKSWRQTIRWLVSDVPQRIEADATRRHDQPGAPVAIAVHVRDEEFKPLDNATATITVTQPDGEAVELTAAPSRREAGVYEASFVPRQTGSYRAAITVHDQDGSEVGRTETGWTAEPAAEEFRRLAANRTLLEELAEKTGGEVIALSDLERFVMDLPNRRIPITEPWIYPLWHQAWVFFFAAACLIGEWGLRRWKGLA